MNQIVDKRYDLENHTRHFLIKEWLFTCKKSKHTYICNEDFDFCPSCGKKLLRKNK